MIRYDFSLLNDSLPKMKREIKENLKKIFGFSSFKANQEEIVNNILKKKDLFAAMPTGGGKSLCYQLPATILPGITIVISPLIALMKDQVDSAIDTGINAAYINSSQKSEDAIKVYSDLHNGRIKLLYISPERFALPTFTERLMELDISLFAIDEAHCLSEWGHDFRKDYLSLANIKELFPTVPVAAFTATATKQVQTDIIEKLKLQKPHILRASFDRPELTYRIITKSKVKDQLVRLVREKKEQAGIIYRTSRKAVEETTAYLKKNGINALPYHAGLKDDIRAKNQELFNQDEVDVIVATIAFGMGIDKSNIRYVIHGDLPKNIEGYYQETGRAGRDGSESECILLFSRGDAAKINYFIEQISTPSEQEKARNHLNQMINYASRNVCRRKQLLNYFEEEHPGDCMNCDVCNNENEIVDISVDCQKFLSAVVRTGQRFGIAHIIDVVRGSENAKVMKFRHNEIKTYGVGKDKSKKHWHQIVDELLGQECIFQDQNKYNALTLTDKGTEVLYGRELVNMLLREDKKEVLLDTSVPADLDLLGELKLVRRQLAKERGIPPYIIFSDKTLIQMASAQPIDSEEFLAISGVGEKKLEEYGHLFIPVIQDWKMAEAK